jgi:hypothetical protein
MNLLARLLLEIRIDFLRLFELFRESLSVDLRQSGMVAKIDGVVSGSLITNPVFSL